MKNANILSEQASDINITLIQPLGFDSKFKEDPFAYKIALLYFTANGISAAMSTTLSPLSKILTESFGLSEAAVWYLNSSFTLHFLFFNSIANYIIDKFGVRKSILLGLMLTVIGAWMRVGISNKLTGLIFGHTIIAIGGPLIANLLSKISNIWFMKENRIKMTSLMSSSYMFGLGLGFLLTSTLWRSDQSQSDLESTKSALRSLMFYSALISTILAIPICVYFRDSPDTPPSLSATSQREDCMTSITTLIKHRDYNILLIAFSFALGNFITMVLMIHHVIAPFNFTIHQISNIGLIINFSSGSSKAIIAYIAPHFKLRKIICTILISLCFCTLLFMFCLSSGNVSYVYFSAFLFGLFCQMYWGPALEYACEIAFPVSESHATGNLVFGGCVMGLITNYSVTIFYGSNPIYFLIYLLISYSVCAKLINEMSDKLNREEFESINRILNK